MPDTTPPDRTWQSLDLGYTAPDSSIHERVMLLELATNLQNWPARNLVFKAALDRAARDIVRMASELDPR